MGAFATVDDVRVFRNVDIAEESKVQDLLYMISDRLRYEAEKVGKDLDAMVEMSATYGEVVKSVTVGICERTLKLIGDDSPVLSQFSESALGYSYSGTVPNAGESLYIKQNELKALGLRRQRYGVIDLWDGSRE